MEHTFKATSLADGRTMINLGCGTRMHWGWTNVDFSYYTYIAHHKLLTEALRMTGLLSEERYKRAKKVDPNIIHWDLRKGIPFPDHSFDVVYHSHVLEHIDKGAAPAFLRECHRVLKEGGVLRVVVPDLATFVRLYVSSLTKLEQGDTSASDEHEKAIHDLFDQMVRVEAAGTQQQHGIRRRIDKWLRGNASKTGELHRWMYDKFSLETLLLKVGFKNLCEEHASTSRIAGWSQFRLDTEPDGTPYKPRSLYMEGVKLRSS